MNLFHALRHVLCDLAPFAARRLNLALGLAIGALNLLLLGSAMIQHGL
jgi:hypothetical protein